VRGGVEPGISGSAEQGHFDIEMRWCFWCWVKVGEEGWRSGENGWGGTGVDVSA
jgi:hypothetical protein